MYLIFTDLDGTLLDFDTYSFDRAAEILSLIRQQNIPLIAVTSKTFAEVQQIMKDMDICHPIVVENGGGIFFPETYPGEYPRTQMENGYFAVPVAQPGLKPIDVLDAIRTKTGLSLKGMSDMSVEDLVSFTGLSVEMAEKARHRHFSEPFIIPDSKSDIEEIIKISNIYNYKIVIGGRFAHLIPEYSGKDKAVKFLIGFYHKLFSGLPVISVGLGDSPNDFDFLSIVDISFLIRKKGQIPPYAGEKWIISQKTGVDGWAEEVTKIIRP